MHRVDIQGIFAHLDVVVVQWLSHVQLFATPWTATRQASLTFIISWSLLKLMSIETGQKSITQVEYHRSRSPRL